MSNSTIPLIRAARRPGADESVSLRKRRAWYDGEGSGAESGTQQKGASAGDPESNGDKSEGEAQDIGALPTWAQTVIKELRKGEAAQRTAKRQAEEEASRRETERLAGEKKFEELAAKLDSDLKAVQPKAERADALEAFLKNSVELRIKALPEADRTLVPEFDDPLKTLEWLDRNAARFTQQRAPDLDAGKKGGDQSADSKVEVTDADRAAAEAAKARGYNLTPEQVAARRQKK